MQTTSFPESSSSDLCVCPSFNAYSISAQLGDDVVSGFHRRDQYLAGEAEGDDFEFVSLSANPDLELNIGGVGIRPVFPVFNRDLLRRDAAAEEEVSICVPLQKLFLDDDDDPPSSSSSSEADEMESVAPGTYCVWTPKLAEPSPSRCEKSSSTGSSATAKQSKRWRFRYLLKRSNSEGGKDSPLVFLPTSETKLKQKADNGKNSKEAKSPARPAGKAVSAHEKFYVRNRKLKEEDKRRTYLPYRRGLVGFFANVNGLGKTFPPF